MITVTMPLEEYEALKADLAEEREQRSILQCKIHELTMSSTALSGGRLVPPAPDQPQQ